jgi:GNAT superfamily N-acetyltransferase
MLKIYQAESEQDRDQVRELFWEYLVWANAGLKEAFGINLDIEQMHEENIRDLQQFDPPHGRLLLVEVDGRIVGVAAMHQTGEKIGEIKRMYVRREFRRQGIGRALLEALIAEAQASGYNQLRLDSARFMHAAHDLYRSAGFKEIDPYPESEIPAQFQSHWIFMERGLGKPPSYK